MSVERLMVESLEMRVERPLVEGLEMRVERRLVACCLNFDYFCCS